MRCRYQHSGFALLIVTAVLLFSFVPGEGDASSCTQGRRVLLSSNTSFPVPAAGDILTEPHTTPACQFRETYDKWSGIIRNTAFLEAHAQYIFHGLVISAGLFLVGIIWIWALTRYARRRTKQLKKTKERYRALFENMSEGIVVIVAGRLAVMNPRATQITGFLPNELSSRAIAEIVAQQDRDTVKEAHRKIMRSEAKSLRFPFRITCKNGDTKWILNNSSGIAWENAPGILSIFSDITENKKLEQQFLQAQKMEAIGQLAGGIAHDFNNILTAISGYGNLLRIKTDSDPALNRYARNILACSERAANLVKGLLAFSRKQVNDPKPTDLHDVIKGAEKMLRRIIGEHIEFSIILSKASPVIFADSNQIIQVLMNLATNARDAMPGGGKVTVRTETVDKLEDPLIGDNIPTEGGRYALLAFEDTGVGMDETLVEKIFDPFFTTKETGKASGLGLATIYGIVKQQKGFVAVQTNPGSGTTFKIYLPIIDTPAETRQVIRIGTPPRGTETILVCEDEADIRKFIREILESHGYSVIEARDGEEGIDSFRHYKDKIGLVLLDVIMPKKSGKDVHDIIVGINPRVKTLFMTGYAAETLQNAGLNEPVSGCLFKPIETDILLAEIRRVLDE